ncbi:hypothetical protein GCWU000325_01608 [Alloprevotella tannerae ATCC 51259]|uniref:Uncharacterized protein n=1 Tax=Alloprevotella tannerae ATCC 51259 TaxID=626522 RepID=C9LHA7_9BACT|nr:hypothetical protein GCWU000325_01608 [Alloprevotella tannerae ATCC 51259]
MAAFPGIVLAFFREVASSQICPLLLFSAAKLRLILQSSKQTTEKLVKTYLRFRRDADSFRDI